MYVCLCHGITDGNVREATRQGASSAREIFDRRGVQPKCRACASHFRALIEENAAPRPDQRQAN
jgi:bacterioferritin-associated ferredoxin